MGGGAEGWTEEEEKEWDTGPEELQTDTGLLMVCVRTTSDPTLCMCVSMCVYKEAKHVFLPCLAD